MNSDSYYKIKSEDVAPLGFARKVGVLFTLESPELNMTSCLEFDHDLFNILDPNMEMTIGTRILPDNAFQELAFEFDIYEGDYLFRNDELFPLL